jgi:prepilin-type processing-associated H-X9-DG protein
MFRWGSEPGHWAISLLPFIEQGPRYAKVDWNLLINQGTNIEVTGVQYPDYPPYVCPSNPFNNERMRGEENWASLTVGGSAMIHYFAVLGGAYPDARGPFNAQNPRGPVKPSPTGYQNVECNRQTNGMFHQVSGVRIAEATDGTSQTALLCEVWGYGPHHDKSGTESGFRCEPNLPGLINLNRVCDGRGMAFSASAKFERANPNGNRGFLYKGYVDRWQTSSSFHPGGFHVTMADGSVRFLSDELDAWTYNGMATKDGAETFELP